MTDLFRPLLQSTPRLAPLATTAPQTTAPRAFSTSSWLLKKRKIAVPSSNSSKPSNDDVANDHHDTASSSSPEDPLDFSAVTAAYAPIDAHFKAQLAGMAHGGRFNPTNLGSLPVTVKGEHHAGGHGHSHGYDEPASSFPLRELAQVVPRTGRTISLLVHDRAYIKPIMSAVQSSKEFNQQPQRAEDNELELLLKVELERKDEVARRVREAVQAWRERIRQVRTRHEKLLKDWKKTGAVLPDLIKKAEKELQKVQDKKMKEIDGEETQLIRQLERNAS